MPKQREAEEEKDLDLIPIMNMVLILIPLLLLSVVFVELTIIDVSLAKIGDSSEPQDKQDKPPPKVELMVVSDGFLIRVNKQAMAPVLDECSGSKETLCMEAERDEKVPTSGYRWHELYNLALQLKNGEHPKYPADAFDWEKTDSIDFILEEDIAFAVLVKAMDVVRYKRRKKGNNASPGESFDSMEDFAKSEIAMVKAGNVVSPAPLFRQPMLGQPVLK
jgi:biopolymer transport protein ExbD